MDMSLTALRAQRQFQSTVNNIDLPAMPAMPASLQNIRMPSADNIQSTASQGWNSLRKAVWDASPSSEHPPSLVRRDTAQGPQGRRKSMAQTSQATGLWSTVYSAVSTSATGLKSKFTEAELYDSDREDYKGESHLTRIMKEYHIGKASSPRDLPHWLFTPQERSVTRAWDQDSRSQTPHASSRSHTPQPHHSAPPAAAGSSFKDIFDSAESAANKSSSRQKSIDSGYSSHSNASSQFSGYQPVAPSSSGSKATDRLRAYREQRRPSAEANLGEQLSGFAAPQSQGQYSQRGGPSQRQQSSWL